MAAGTEASDHGGSFYNKKEAEFVGCLINRLLQDGIDSNNIGVVTLYKSQQSKIAEVLMNMRYMTCHLVSAICCKIQSIAKIIFLHSCLSTLQHLMIHV